MHESTWEGSSDFCCFGKSYNTAEKLAAMETTGAAAAATAATSGEATA